MTFEEHSVRLADAVVALERVITDAKADGFSVTLSSVNPEQTMQTNYVFIELGRAVRKPTTPRSTVKL